METEETKTEGDWLIYAMEKTKVYASSHDIYTLCGDIPEGLFNDYLQGIEDKDRTRFIDAMMSFLHYYREVRPSGGGGVSGVWTNFVVLILFGLIEAVMREHEYRDCYSYLDGRKNENIELNVLLEQWKNEYGSNEKVRIFFKTCITDERKQAILDNIKNDPKWQDAKTIDDFISKIMEYRHQFVHTLSLESISVFNVRLAIKNIEEWQKGDAMKLQWYDTLAIDSLISAVLRGVLRKFDEKNMLLNYY